MADRRRTYRERGVFRHRVMTETRGRKKLVMIGNGMAGVKMMEVLLGHDDSAYEITIFGAEKHPNYNRILLSSVLAGEASVKDIILNDEEWYEAHNINLHLGKKVTEIDRDKKVIRAEDGTEAEYDVLVIATGSSPFILPIPGVEHEGVITFRDINDCDMMIDASKLYKKGAVIGGGLLGLEAAKGLINLGMDVTVIHDQPYLMNMQLDRTAGELLQKDLEGQGMNFLLSTLTKEIKGEGEGGRVTSLTFEGGGELPCDLVAMSVGIRPNKVLGDIAGIETNRGIVVNDYMQSVTDDSIFALGECAEHRGATYGLVAPLFEQAKVLARYLASIKPLKGYKGSLTSTKLKISGVDVFSAGDYIGDDTTETMEYIDRKGGVYKKLVIRDDFIQGAVMFGDTSDGPTIFDLMKNKVDIWEDREGLLFGGAGRAMKNSGLMG